MLQPLLISASSPRGGGLFSFEDGCISRIDRLTTMGLWASDGRLARLLKSPDAADSMTEVIIYDERGARHYHRLDGLGDPHDIAWTGNAYAVVSSIQNRISWITAGGEIVRTWEAPGEADSWHINCLFQREGELYVSVFGRFATHRGWAEEKHGNSGFLYRLSDACEVVGGLSQPHTPRFVDGKWIVCNSAKHELLQVDEATGTVERRLKLNGYTRGIAILDDVFVVGESAGRYAPERTNAAICFIDRRTWEVIDRQPVDGEEVYDIVPVDETLIAGAKAGFRTSRFRTTEQDQYYLFQQAGVEPARLWAVGERLPAGGFSAQIEADVPESVNADAVLEIPVTIANRGNSIFVTAPPYPVHVCYRWRRSEDGTLVSENEWLHTPLAKALPPGATLTMRATIATPEEPGEYVLHVTLLQQDVAWFDDLNPTSASLHRVRVSSDAPAPVLLAH